MARRRAGLVLQGLAGCKRPVTQARSRLRSAQVGDHAVCTLRVRAPPRPRASAAGTWRCAPHHHPALLLLKAESLLIVHEALHLFAIDAVHAALLCVKSVSGTYEDSARRCARLACWASDGV